MAWASSIRYMTTADAKKDCFAPRGHVQRCADGPARFLLTAVNEETGEVRLRCACGNHAAWWCAKSDIFAQWENLRAPPAHQQAYPISRPRLKKSA